MLTTNQVELVRRLLSEGKSQRAVRAQTRIARGTIADIAHDRRPDYETIRQARRAEKRTKPRGPREQCPGCGYVVYMPCRICRARRWRLFSLVWNGSKPVPELQKPLGMELKPEHQARYEEVRRNRRNRRRPSRPMTA